MTLPVTPVAGCGAAFTVEAEGPAGAVTVGDLVDVLSKLGRGFDVALEVVVACRPYPVRRAFVSADGTVELGVGRSVAGSVAVDAPERVAGALQELADAIALSGG